MALFVHRDVVPGKGFEKPCSISEANMSKLMLAWLVCCILTAPQSWDLSDYYYSFTSLAFN